MVKKPTEPLKDLTFSKKNKVYFYGGHLEYLFDLHGRTKSDRLKKEYVDKLYEDLQILINMQEHNTLHTVLDSPNLTRKLESSINKLETIKDQLHNIRATSPISTDQIKGIPYYLERITTDNLNMLRQQILSDLIQTLISVHTISTDETVNAIDALSVVRHISINMLWILDEGYHELFQKKLRESEIIDLLNRKYVCRLFEDEHFLQDWRINAWFKGYAAKDTGK
ncbi:hypothetical protein ACEWK1_14510 [Metabacillus sp. YM-086]|uniref:hypothetical protein n=1 Tax=Metabacillus sp. YM-086 TaxID=3341729 RepID=UPI003A86F3BF